MTGPLGFETSHPASLGRRGRLIFAILASLVLLVAVGVVEVGALAAVSVISSGTNHAGIK
ncbi:MAG TPA: hypothetical protein VGF80_03620 [Galbitalea sp.]|jgi:hypothetical protein